MPGEKLLAKRYVENESLLPIPSDKRIYGTATFTWMMFSMNVCIPLFFLGSIGLSLGLSLVEVAVGALLGNLATTIVLILNGLPGVKYGIPYPVQLRPSWGFKGSRIPVVLRGIVGAGWYGIEAYSGSLAMLMVALYIFGFAGRDPTVIATTSFRYVAFVVALYILFATLVTAKGLAMIARVVNITGPLLITYFIWLALQLSGQNGINYPQTEAGFLSKNFATYLAIQTNFWATMSLNISDLSRGLHSGRRGVRALIIGPVVGIVLTSVIASILGYYLTFHTGYSTPQEIVLYTAPGVLAVIFGQVFASLAPFSTDITANIPALVNVLTTCFKMKWMKAAVVAGVVGFFLAPWWAVEKGPDILNYVVAFTSNYGVILGPIAGIMIADYFIVNKNYDLEKLYTNGPEGYWYRNGYNLIAIASYVISVIIIYAFSYSIGDLVMLGPLPFPTSLSWYIGVISTLVIYSLLAKSISPGRRKI
ncbi:MAG: cytosine permease [Thermosphaera sp.]